MNIFRLIQGQWGLTRDAEFRKDPWYILAANRVVDAGFGKPPKGFFSNKLDEGVIIPGLVNSHSHIELSSLKDKISPGSGIVEMARRIQAERAKISDIDIRNAAITAVQEARSFGTFYFCDTINDTEFASFIKGLPAFHGNRYLELLGFKNPSDSERIAKIKPMLEEDMTLLPTIHSVYGSSPTLMNFVREKARSTSISFHLLESPEEIDFMHNTGAIVDFLKSINQYTQHREMSNKSIVDYLNQMGMLSFKKLLLVHLSSARREGIAELNELIPHAAWVLCHRSNKHLGIERTNWEALKLSPMKLLLGTDSLATAPNLSILHEMRAIEQTNHFSTSELWKAATYDAYEYLEISTSRIPYYFFPGALPEISSMCQVRAQELI